MRLSFQVPIAALLLISCGPKPTPQATGPTASEVAAQEAACAYTPGMMAADTVPAGDPTGVDIPIRHIILLMQENRSFDHYFSELDIPGLNVAPADASNPDGNGHEVQRFNFIGGYPGGGGPGICMDGGDHGWDPEHMNLDNGKLDGFVTTNQSPVPMGYYDGTVLSYYYALAKTFAFSDSHFCSALAPTWPNRMFYMAGTSWGLTGNSFPPGDMAPDGKPYVTLFSELDAAHIDWRNYNQDVPTPLILPNLSNDLSHFRGQAQFAVDVANGDLAPVTMVEMSDLQGPLSADEGPPGDPQLGQEFTSGVISTIMNSPFWKDSVIFLTYDENGGMYDHVVPPKACIPDDNPPILGTSSGGSYPAQFDQYGFRVPFFVISPYAKRGYLSHQVGDHTAILRFVEAKFNLAAMTKRDANALPPYDMFDFDHPDFSVPDLPTVVVNESQLNACYY